MWRRIVKSFLVTLIAVLVVGVPASYYLKQPRRPEVQETMEQPDTTEVRSDKPGFYLEIRKKFIREGWTTEAVDNFLRLNDGWFTMLRQVDSLAYGKQMTLLADLGNYRGIMPFLEEHPESGALFAVAEKPTLLLRLFESSGGDYDFLVNLYVLHAAPMNADLLTDALENNADLISKLYRRGLVGSEVIFLFNRTDESGFEYDQWLREILTVKMDKTDAELASLLNMVLKYGPEIRLRLRSNESFRITFRSTIWPKLVRVAAGNHNMFDIYLGDPRIWDLLALPEGERLLRLRGLLSIDLLYGYPELGRSPYPPDLHGTVIQALLKGDEQTFRVLVKFRDEVLFHDLARRAVATSVKTAAFRNLFEAGNNYHGLLQRYSKMSDKGLQSEVGTPPSILKTWTPFFYTIWEVPKKLLQGRNPTSTEWFNSLADPVSFLYPILKIGVAVVNVGKTVAVIDQDGKIGPNLKKTSLQIAEQQLGAALAAKLSDQELIPFGVTGMLTRMQQVYRETVSTTTIVDSTRPVRFMLSYSGASHRSLETLNLIDGRILLRGDARLVIQPGNDFPDKEVSGYLEDSANGFVADSLNSPSTGKQVPSGEVVAPPDHDALTAWRQNVSGWWLMQVSGMLRKTTTGNPRPH
ncbi:MAG: hypothetical protein ABFS18_12720 [Thermodesulfobacteriota bacterium]